jgi:hypothetical protein
MGHMYLANNEEVLPLHHFLLDLLLDCFSHFILIVIDVGTVNVAVSCINGHLHSFFDFAWARLKGNTIRCSYLRTPSNRLDRLSFYKPRSCFPEDAWEENILWKTFQKKRKKCINFVITTPCPILAKSQFPSNAG